MTSHPSILRASAIFVWFAVASFAEPVPEAGALSPAEAAKSFQLADGLRIELVAAEPLVASPCAMAFDERARLFVAENRGYPNTSEPPQGIVAMLEDTDGDGRMDKRTVFADGLTYPNGVMPWKGGLIVTCAPDVLYLKDTDGDGRADERRVLLTGFEATKSTQLRANCPTLGPDGWIYFAAGLSGGSITSPEHPERPAVKMTGDIRWNPVTGELEDVDGRGQFAMAFDDFGRRFICMNRVQVQHVVLSSAWLKRNPRLTFSDTVQNCPEPVPNIFMRGKGGAARLYPISSNVTTADSHAGTFTAACGVNIWRGGALPKIYRGCVFSCDPTGNLVHVDKLVPSGASFLAEPLLDRREFVASKDDWFRPVFTTSGPDGALYICDMYRKVIEHPDYLSEEVRKRTDFESGKTMGRIWRVVKKDARWNPDDFPRVRLGTSAWIEDAAAIVAEEDGWARQMATRLLVERRSPDAPKVFQKALGSTKRADGYAAICDLLAVHGALDAATRSAAATHASPGVRERALMSHASDPEEVEWKKAAAIDLASDADARVRFAAALVLGDDPKAGATKSLAKIAAKDAGDRWTRAAVLSGISGREQDFLVAFLNQIQDVGPGAQEVLRGAGRGLKDIEALKLALGAADGAPGLGRELCGPAVASLLLSLSDGTGKRLVVTPTEQWLEPVLAEAVRVSVDAARPAAMREVYVTLLGRMEWRTVSDALLKLAASEPDEALRAVAIRALCGFGQPEAPKALLPPGAWARYTPAQRETIISALLGSGALVAGVLDAIEAGALPASAISTIRRGSFLKHKDAAVRDRATKLFEMTGGGDRKKAFEDAKVVLTMTSNGAHGREVFRNICSMCHRLDQEGHAVGPDLFDIRRQPKESILFHLIVTDAEIAPQFSAYVVETKDGRTLSGILASETPTSVTLRGPLAQETSVLRSEILTLEAAPGSLMPNGLETTMSRQDLADLLAFLKGEAQAK
jgi:putative membrane-bound dehydrogenase-like protein